jgi:hypothetical protein
MEELEADDHSEAMVQVTLGYILGLCDGCMHPKVFQTEHLYKRIKRRYHGRRVPIYDKRTSTNK